MIRRLWKDDERGLKKKKMFEREVSELEPFAESVPSALVMTFQWMRTHDFQCPRECFRLYDTSGNSTNFEAGDACCQEATEAVIAKRELLIGKYGSIDEVGFYIAFSTSVICASLGLAKVNSRL